jgi:hypothetical protein
MLFLAYVFNYIKREEIVKIKTDDIGKISLEIRDEERGFLRNLAEKVAEFIYDEAEKSNPQGDALPDEIDDKIREKLKEKIN